MGLVAINDSFLIEGSIYKLLKQYFRSDPYYLHIVEMFHEVTNLHTDRQTYGQIDRQIDREIRQNRMQS